MKTRTSLLVVLSILTVVYSIRLDSQGCTFSDDCILVVTRLSVGAPLYAVSYCWHESSRPVDLYEDYPYRAQYRPGFHLSMPGTLLSVLLLAVVVVAFFLVSQSVVGRLVLTGIVLAGVFGPIVSCLQERGLQNADTQGSRVLSTAPWILVALVIALVIAAVASSRPFRVWKPPAVVLPFSYTVPWVSLWFDQFLLKNRASLTSPAWTVLGPKWEDMLTEPTLVGGVMVLVTYIFAAAIVFWCNMRRSSNNAFDGTV